MQYMVIERFKPGKVKEMYERFDTHGRMLPAGVNYIGSWINEDVTTCYQMMESESENLLQKWLNHWQDLVDFEVIPVISSAEAREKVFAAG